MLTALKGARDSGEVARIKRTKGAIIMTEEIKNEAIETEENEQVDTQEPTVKVAEMKRRIEQEQKKAQEQIEELKTSQEQAIQEALAKYKAENELSGKELEKYRQQQAEAEKQKLLDQIKQLELQNTRRELKDEAIKTLSDKKLPVNEKILSFVVRDTAEDTLSAIEDMGSIILDIKNQYASTDAPLGSGGSVNNNTQRDMFDIFDGK